MLSLEIVSLASLVFWVLVSLDRQRSWPAEVVLPDVVSQERVESVVAIVPARNEAEILPQTLPTLLRQGTQGMRVVLVDDGSTDGTGQVARQLASDMGSQKHLQVVSAGVRLAGWSGKVHALLCGYVSLLEESVNQNVEPPEWLLLTDADIRHRSGSVQSLLQQARTPVGGGSYDLVSVMAHLRTTNFWERLIIPAFVFFFQLMYPFRRVGNRRSMVAAAAGGCVLVRRSVLEDAGGFAAIAGEIIDDVALGRVVKKRGGAIWLGFDPGIVSLRAYPSLDDLWQMVSRTAFTQLRYRWDLLILTLAALGVFVVSPPLILGVSLVTATGSGDPSSLPWAGVWALTAWVLMWVAYLPAIRHYRLSAIYAWTLPMAGLLFGLMTATSAIDDWRGKGPSWRGRDYDPS